MLQIKIDKKNISFRDCHCSKVKDGIKKLIEDKLNEKDIFNFERDVLKWLLENLDLILLSKVNELRKIIKKFNNFIEMYNNNIFLSLSNIKLEKSKTELEKINKQYLKNVCFYNDIEQSVSQSKKVDYIDLIISNITTSHIPIPDEIKFYILKQKTMTLVSNIFENFYENKWDKIKDYNRYVFIQKHNLKTCPYCNMGYILISEKDKNQKNGLRPEIDHFFPKSKYPYLAMSFYNLIPSCKVCNHSKGNKDSYMDNLLSPYEIDKNTFKLTYKLNSITFIQMKKRKYHKDDILEVKFKKIDKYSNEYFKLEKLYKQHKDVVLELLLKKIYYPDSYIQELKKFGFSKDEIYRYLLCNYKEAREFHKRPLSKLVKDISEELGLV